MARYIQDVPLNQPLDVVSEIMENYIYRNRYFRTDWQGEPVYLSTDSAEGGERYFKWSYTNGTMHIEAWMKGSFGKESDLSGGGKKQAYKESLERLIMILKNPPEDEYSRPFEESGYTQPQSGGYAGQNAYTQPQSGGYAGQNAYTQPQSGGYAGQNAYTTAQQGTSPQMPNTSQPVYTQPWMNNTRGSAPFVLPGKPGTTTGRGPGNTASVSFGFGVAALCLSIFFPMFGLIMAIMGIQKSKEAMIIDPGNKKGKTGKTLSTVAIVISIIMLLSNFMLPMFIAFFSLGNLY
ncbi:MAG: hypothetical protein ACI4EQ_06290 [Lachnospiraceae bacterium]